MEILEIIGYVCAVLVGLVMGFMGAGAAIMALPIFQFLFQIDDIKVATAYSGFVAGVTATFGVIQKAISKEVNYRVGAIFAIPAVTGFFISRRYLQRLLLDSMSGFIIDGELLLMGLFSIALILAAISMFRGRKDVAGQEVSTRNYISAFIMGVLVGIFTGVLGLGGGFMIIPVLVSFIGLSMKEAVGTSLFVVALKSLIGGVSGDLLNPEISINWSFLLTFSALAVGGILLGLFLSTFVSGHRLKKAFGFFLLAMGVLVLGTRIQKLTGSKKVIENEQIEVKNQ